MKFRFRLQAVLDNRAFLQEQAENEMAIAVAELNKLVEKLEENRLLQENAESENRKRMIGKIDVAALTLSLSYMGDLQNREEAIRRDMGKAEKVVEEKRQLLIEARQNKEALEKLKERDFIQWRKEMLYEEQKNLDEMALAIYRRKGQKN